MGPPNPPPYFPRLDEFRFLAAFGIVVHHIEQLKALHGYGNWYAGAERLRSLVTFFFVLSGFLITHLLLAERAASGTVALKRFYLRRCLRIGPVYYAVAGVAFFVLPWVGPLALPGLSARPAADWWATLVLFLLFLPNVAISFYPAVPYAAQAWSVGVEEQFYLTWPLLARFARRPLAWMLGVVVVGAAARVAVEQAVGPGPLATLLAATRVGCMALGGVAAYLLFHRRRAVLAVVFHPATQFAAAGLIAAVVGGYVRVPYLGYETEAVLYGVVVLNAAANPATLFRVGSPALARLGRWSYGIYMYHPVAIGVGIWAVGRGPGFDLGRVGPSAALYAVVTGLTVGASYLSYRYFETPILNLSRRRPPAAPAVPPAAPAARAA